MEIKIKKEFISPVTCVNGPVGKDKYLVNFIIENMIIGTKTFESIKAIDKEAEVMKNDPDLKTAFIMENIEPIVTFEIAEVKTLTKKK